MMRQAQQTPAMPMLLLAVAPRTPAADVPWPLSSVVSGALPTKAEPGTNRPRRSGWVASAPLSSTATTTDAEPVVVSQARGALIFAGPHSAPQLGSLGVMVAVVAASVSAYETSARCASAVTTRSAAAA